MWEGNPTSKARRVNVVNNSLDDVFFLKSWETLAISSLVTGTFTHHGPSELLWGNTKWPPWLLVDTRAIPLLHANSITRGLCWALGWQEAADRQGVQLPLPSIPTGPFPRPLPLFKMAAPLPSARHLGLSTLLGGAPLSSRWCASPTPAPEAPSARAQRPVPLLPLSAAASGPPFLGNNGAENGRLRGEAGRRLGCLGTDGARQAGTEPAEDRREQRSESWGDGGGRWVRRPGRGRSRWHGEGRGPGPGEAAAAASARRRGRPGDTSSLAPWCDPAEWATGGWAGQDGPGLRGARQAAAAWGGAELC